MKRRGLIVAPQARRDFIAIVDWYRKAVGGRSAAKVTRTLQAGLLATRSISLSAATRADLPDGYYRVIAKVHLVIFRIEGSDARVVRIIHGARDIPGALADTEL
jgi:plasmid stabilization system protein ParE